MTDWRALKEQKLAPYRRAVLALLADSKGCPPSAWRAWVLGEGLPEDDCSQWFLRRALNGICGSEASRFAEDLDRWHLRRLDETLGAWRKAIQKELDDEH